MAGSAVRVHACEVALVLAIDVSGSIDRAEYRLQTEGLARALEDPELIDALVATQAALSVLQWSGAGQQTVTLSWQRMNSAATVAEFAARARAMPRAFEASDTAVGEALAFAAALFSSAPDCRRRVIDISGDGPQNAGMPLDLGRMAALRSRAQINAIAIEDMGRATPISTYYARHVTSPDGFVVTARGLSDYPRAIRDKILREITRPTG
nr:DUF1194 domain-containing protein [Albidovulum inexpectatum]